MKNEDCVISDSVVCKWMNRDCESCYINSLKHDDDAKKALADFEVTLSLLPDNFDELQGDECVFCKGEKKKQDGFAVIDMAHREPKSERGMFFGIGKKVRQRIGSLMPVSISICKECRRAFWMIDIIKWVAFVVVLAIGIGLMAIPSFYDPISSANEAIPFAVIIVAGVIGYVLGRVFSDIYVKIKSKDVCFNIFEIPICADMQKIGWFSVQEDEGITRFVFSKKSHTKKIADLKESSSEPQEECTQTSFL